MQNFKFPIDLHVHSKHSIDGEYTCETLIKKAAERGIRTLALADHNCVKGIDEMQFYGNKNNVAIIPALEFDSLFHHMETHILGYGINYHNEQLLTLDDRINQLETKAFERRIEVLQTVFNIQLDKQELLKRCEKENPFQVIYGSFLENEACIHNPELKPYVLNKEKHKNAIVDFYWEVCSYGKKAYVEIAYPNVEDVVEMIHQHHGIAILAHPGLNFYQNEKYLDELLQIGIEGIEVYSTYHDPLQIQFFKNYAHEKKLFITGGSDFHGAYKPSIILGDFGLSQCDEQDIQPFLTQIHNLI